MHDAHYYIEHLKLKAHPEGGYFCEMYRAGETIPRSGLPKRFTGDRAFSTAIYFLLKSGEISAFHRIKQDELWHFYDGGTARIHMIAPDGAYRSVTLGRNIEKGEQFQVVVPAGYYFAAEVIDPSARTMVAADSFVLVGCTVAPGFDFADFEMPTRDDLCAQFPQHQDSIMRLTH